MDDFNKRLETINKYLEADHFNSIFPICEKILNDDFTQTQKSQICFIMACTYKEIKNYEKALVSFSDCIKFDSNKEYAYVRKSELLFMLDRIEAALVCSKQGLLIFNENTMLIKIKNLCVKKLCQFNLKAPINNDNIMTEKITKETGNDKVVHNFKLHKLELVIIVLIIAILVFLGAFFFAYRAFS